MRLTFGCDPGKHGTAVAIAVEGVLKDVKIFTQWDQPTASLIHNNAPVGCKIILEVPRHYPGGTPANDLIDEVTAGAIIAGAIQHSYPGSQIIKVHPNSTSADGRAGWKGQICKPLHHRRILKALTPSELAILLGIKKDLIAYVEAACQRYATTKKVTGYKAEVHNHLDAAGMILDDEGRI
jgi:hypothetical protein